MNYSPILWKQKPAIALQQCPHDLASWLQTRGSMTERMQQQCAGRLQVKILNQSWQCPTWEESQFLGIDLRSKVLSREVILLGNNIPWMYARSLFPHQLFQGEEKWIQHALNSTPIGELLYRYPNMYRDEFQFAKVRQDHWGYQRAKRYTNIPTDHLWARRSKFYLNKKPLLLSEFFLPRIGESNEN